MELHAENLSELADITSATLVERASGEGVLRLEFAGWGADWLRYMEPVSLYRRGELIFHGKVVEFSRTNEGGSIRASAEVQNFFWLLERQSLGQQLAELQEAAEGGSGTAVGDGTWEMSEVQAREKYAVNASALMGRLAKGQIGKHAAQKISGGGYRVTWGMAVAGMRTYAPGWTVLPKSGGYTSRAAAVGTLGNGELTVECSPGVRYRQMWATTDKMVTTASALWRKAQDVQYIVDYAAGTVTAMGIGELPELELKTDDGVLLSAADVSPQYADCVTGVAIVWTNDAGQTELHTYPAELDMAQDGVKVFSLTGSYYVESWDTAAREYYEAANVVQLGGTLRLLADRLPVSPLGRRLRLSGPGTHAEWAAGDVYAVATCCEWDLLERTVTVQLGREFSDPEFAEAAVVEDGGDYVEEYERNMSGAADGHWPFLSNEGSGSGGGGGGGWGSASKESKYVVESLQLRESDGCSPGVDGWVQVFFLGGSLDWQDDYAYSYRQLMRFKEDGDKVYLQVVTQRQNFETNEWEPV